MILLIDIVVAFLLLPTGPVAAEELRVHRRRRHLALHYRSVASRGGVRLRHEVDSAQAFQYASFIKE